MASNAIVIRGAREHNLHNVDVSIPRDKLVVITGLSGSGKSSLAFDTIYAEGQRRYVESLSSYAPVPGQDGQAGPRLHRRPVAGGLDQPEDDDENPRSTVGTVTETMTTCAYSSRAWARRTAGVRTRDRAPDNGPGCGQGLAQGQGRRALVLAPVVLGRKGEYTKLFEDLRGEGFSACASTGRSASSTGRSGSTRSSSTRSRS